MKQKAVVTSVCIALSLASVFQPFSCLLSYLAYTNISPFPSINQTMTFTHSHINSAHEHLSNKGVKNLYDVCCRLVSATTTPTQLSPVSRTSLATPGSPLSDMSAPLSSQAFSVPSVALSPSGEEECPLLLSNTRQPNKSLSRNEQKRNSAHFNHGHEAHSLPPSPLFTMENGNYQIIGDHETTASSHMFLASPEKLCHTNNNIDCSTKRTTNAHLLHNVESSGVGMLVSKTEEPQGGHMPCITTDSTTALLFRAMYSRRTNPASPNDDLQAKLSSSATKQDPVAV